MTADAPPSDPGRPVSARVAAVAPLMSREFSAATIAPLRHALRRQVEAAGLIGDSAYDFVLAVHELVTNAVRHGGGHGRLDLRRQDDVLICEITDRGLAAGDLPVRLPATDTAGGRGLWLAQQLADGLVLTRHLEGVSATVTVCLEPAGGAALPPGAGPPVRPVADDQE